MTNYHLPSHLDSIHATFPAATHKPVIGITANYEGIDATLRDRYYKQVVEAGGVPVIIPPIADKEVIINTLDHIDGLLLSGGGDYNPLWAGEQPSPKLGHINAERDLPELLITRLAFNRQIPMLGICRGIQTLAMALGGKVEQDIMEERGERNEECGMWKVEPPSVPSRGKAQKGVIRHSQDADRSEPTHTVSIAEGSILHDLYCKESPDKSLSSLLPPLSSSLPVNSFHHQAVSDPGPRFCVTATAPDGIIEAIESSEHKPVMGVQWHPEWLGKDGLPLFQWLVSQAAAFSQAKEVHRRTLTLDTHCDTPMFFHQDIHFEQRDPKILVDLHKMTEGRQDAVTMVAYLPQPKPGEVFADKVDTSWCPTGQPVTPVAYTDLIFDRIEEIVAVNSRYVRIARTPDELYQNKADGVKSIMIGIENGLALEHRLENVRHFADRGIVYITLCHNGDNDICDSARGSNTWGGVSEFGEQVIREMNRLGIMVDLSHAAEKSFYDALDISSTPIVCSHSNCRALCEHPRNLTDDQLRALARRGGVAHITLYHGFLRQEGEASILDAMDHLEHAIRIMGIDHVGLGTDFDGDGGVRGIADSSELINFTLQLLRRRFSEEDIRKIWGGNWLRVMQNTQCRMQNA
ncbi:MAG: membrane dipeptidase [Prevotella sp.]|nr:membrane dipeptidase [Prevotella sp.]